MSYFKLGNLGFLASGALLLAGHADAATLPASQGATWDPAQASCIFRDFFNPARVFLSGSCGTGSWDMPMPISTFGSKSFSVHLFSGDNTSHSCIAHVAGADGVPLRTASKTFNTWGPAWLNLPAVQVNAGENVVIRCTLTPSVQLNSVKGF